MLNYISNYFKKNKYMITVFENGLYIYNYEKIISIHDKKIEVIIDNKNINIDGESIVITKLLSNELLIKGKIYNIKVNSYE